MTVLVDSDIVVEVCRARDPDIASRWRELGRSGRAILYSPVTAAELWNGVRPREHEALTGFFRALVCVPIDYETGRHAGDYLRQYGKSHGLQIGDALIAAAAVLNRAELWTRNRKHYPMKELSFY
ncbi:MAG: type II toxin-antitoxin system VapC family toxin [Terriglobales bacterium]